MFEKGIATENVLLNSCCTGDQANVYTVGNKYSTKNFKQNKKKVNNNKILYEKRINRK